MALNHHVLAKATTDAILQNFKSATIFRKTIQQQGAKQNTLDAFKKLADLIK